MVVIVILQGTIAVAVDMLPLPEAWESASSCSFEYSYRYSKPVIASRYDLKPGTWLLRSCLSVRYLRSWQILQ